MCLFFLLYAVFYLEKLQNWNKNSTKFARRDFHATEEWNERPHIIIKHITSRLISRFFFGDWDFLRALLIFSLIFRMNNWMVENSSQFLDNWKANENLKDENQINNWKSEKRKFQFPREKNSYNNQIIIQLVFSFWTFLFHIKRIQYVGF